MKYVKLFEAFFNNIGSISINTKMYDFRIPELYNFIKTKNYKIEKLDVKKLYKNCLTNDFKNITVKKNNKWIKFEDLPKKDQDEIIDDENKQIDKSSLIYPIIIIKQKNENTIIDGNHRLKKAFNIKADKIKAYVIPEEDILDAIKNKELTTV